MVFLGLKIALARKISHGKRFTTEGSRTPSDLREDSLIQIDFINHREVGGSTVRERDFNLGPNQC